MSTEYLFIYLCLLPFRVFYFQVKFIPRYLILFVAIINGIVFLISLSASSLLAYRNSTFLYVEFVPSNFTVFTDYG